LIASKCSELNLLKNTTAEWKTARTATLLQGASTETKQSTNFKLYVHQQTLTRVNKIGCIQALHADSASALDRALPGHCIPLGVEVSFGKGLS